MEFTLFNLFGSVAIALVISGAIAGLIVWCTSYKKEGPFSKERPSDALGSVTHKELMMVVSTYDYSTYKRIKEDLEIHRGIYSTNFTLDAAIDRIMANRVIAESEAL